MLETSSRTPSSSESSLLVEVRRFLGHNQIIGDVFPIAVLALLSLPHFINQNPFSLEHSFFMIALVVPLLWRRRRPVAVMVVLSTIAFIQYLADVRLAFDVTLLAAVYSVAIRSKPREVITAGVVLELGVLLAAFSWVPVERRLITLVFLTGMNIAALIGGLYIRTRHSYLLSLEDRARQLEEERETQLNLAAAAERARIAREMHDVVSHSLSVIVALADGATFSFEKTPHRAQQAMQSVAATGRDAMSEMRRLLDVLGNKDDATELAPQPGIAQLDELISQVRAAGLSVRYETSGHSESMPAGVQLAVYRAVQESLTNALKHAVDATEALVLLEYSPSGLTLRVSNNGANVENEPSSGRGLHGMRERVAMYGGTVNAGPLNTGGWQVAVHIDQEQLRPS